LRLGGVRRRGPGRHHPLGVAQPPEASGEGPGGGGGGGASPDRGRGGIAGSPPLGLGGPAARGGGGGDHGTIMVMACRAAWREKREKERFVRFRWSERVE
jgi:hypothetical protein